VQAGLANVNHAVDESRSLGMPGELGWTLLATGQVIPNSETQITRSGLPS
jgi:hypothetical protein